MSLLINLGFLYLKRSIPGSKNTEVIVKKSVKNIKKLTIGEKIAAAEVAVGLSLVIVAYRLYKNIDIADFRSLKG